MSNITDFVEKARTKVNHGPCKVCGKPILYEHAQFCGPKCHFSVLRPENSMEPGSPDKEIEEAKETKAVDNSLFISKLGVMGSDSSESSD